MGQWGEEPSFGSWCGCGRGSAANQEFLFVEAGEDTQYTDSIRETIPISETG